MRFGMKNRNGLCETYAEVLEELPVDVERTSGFTKWRAGLPAEMKAHAEACESCKDATDTFWASRELLKGMRAETIAASWFATRVMTGIADRELQVGCERLEWSGAVARLGSRLAWASLVAMLVASTWIYGARVDMPARNSSSDNGQYLFDNASTPANGDDALVSIMERPQ